MRIQNPITHHPLISGVKFAIFFLLLPIYNNGMSLGGVDFWSWYSIVIIVFYPIEILCAFLFITGHRAFIDSTRDYDDEVFVYIPYHSNSPYIYDITNEHIKSTTHISNSHH